MILTGTLHAAAICMHPHSGEITKEDEYITLTQDSYSKLSKMIISYFINLRFLKSELEIILKLL